MSLGPTLRNTSLPDNDNDITVVTSNCMIKQGIPRHRPSLASTARALYGALMPQYLNALTLVTNQAIADTGAMLIFIMDGAPIYNKRVTWTPLTINLSDSKKIYSTHICDIHIPGLSTILTGHMVPSLTIASLIGIWPLCKTGCTVTFDNSNFDVKYNGRTILTGFKDPTTDLWMLPIPTNGRVGTTQSPIAANPIIAHNLFSCQARQALKPAIAMASSPPFPSVVMENSFAAPMVSQSGPCMDHAPLPTIIPTVAIAAFTHSVQTCSNLSTTKN